MTPSHTVVPLIVLALLLALERPVAAYLDPGSGSMLMQVLLGGVAGAAVVLKLAWTRLKDRFASRRQPDARSND